jgi:hypothetical protein
MRTKTEECCNPRAYNNKTLYTLEEMTTRTLQGMKGNEEKYADLVIQ